MPCTSGYRPNHDFGVRGKLNDAVHAYFDKDWVAPGESVIAHLSFLAPDDLEDLGGRLHEGFEFTVQEGARIVGRGRITRVFNEALARPEP